MIAKGCYGNTNKKAKYTFLFLLSGRQGLLSCFAALAGLELTVKPRLFELEAIPSAIALVARRG